RAARYGVDAWIILDEDNNECLLQDDLDNLLETLAPVAERLRCTDDLALVPEIIRRGASYQRQRVVAEVTGDDLVAVVDSVVRDLDPTSGRAIETATESAPDSDAGSTARLSG